MNGYFLSFSAYWSNCATIVSAISLTLPPPQPNNCKPKNNSDLFINDYISQATNGRGSSTSYKPAKGEGIGGGSYTNSLAQDAKKATSNKPAQQKVTYTGDPTKMFSSSSSGSSSNGFANLNLLFSGINYDPIFVMHAQEKYQENLKNEQKIAQTKVISGQGFTGKEVNGKTVIPGSVVKDQTSKVQNMGIDVLTSAQNLPEVIASAISATINQAMLHGIGNMEAIIHREISNVRSQTTAQNNAANKSGGPGSQYKR